MAAGGDTIGAVPTLARSVAILEAAPHPLKHELAAARCELAKALVATGGDRKRARVLAEKARDGLAPGQAEECEALLATLR